MNMSKTNANSLRAADGMELVSRFAGRQPTTLKMRDGGMLDSIKGAFGFGPTETITEKYARRDAEFKAAHPELTPQAPAAPAPTPAPATRVLSDYVGNSALDRRMKAAGLRDGGELRTGQGGDVPGSGHGDKIPAKYEPGEFVVSNDMLDAQPELRDHLRGLRSEVLAEKGMTPEQADAKALNGGSLRAELGWTADALQGKRMLPPATPMQSMAEQLKAPAAPAPVAPPAPPKYTPPPVNPATGGYVNESAARSNPGIQGGAQGRGPSGGISGGVLGNADSVSRPAGLDTPGKVGLRANVQAQPRVLEKAAVGVGQLAGAALRKFGPMAAGVDAVSHFNDYKINDPGVDSSASGTWAALRDGDLAGAGRSLGKGALEAGMDLGSFAANTADYVVPGKAPVSTAYNKLLRDNFGSRLVDNSGSNAAAAPGVTSPAATVAAVPPAAPAQTYPNPSPTSAARSPRTGSPDLKDEFSNASIESRNPNGKVTRVGNSYSGGNVSGEVSFQGADGNALRGRPGGGYMVAGATPSGGGSTMSQYDREVAEAQAARAFEASKGPSQWEQERDARNAKVDRSGMLSDLRRQGLSARQAAAHVAQLDQTAATREGNRLQSATSLRTTGMNNDTSLKTNEVTNRTALRGQDMDFEGKRLSVAASRARMQYDVAKDQRDYDTSRHDKRLEQDRAASGDAASAFKGLFDTTDNEGKPVSRPDLEAQANLVAQRASGGKWATLNPEERAKNVGNAHSYVTLLDSARQHQNNGWLQAAGIDSPDAPWGGLPSPDELSKGTLERVGLREGAMTPGTGKGDYALRLPDGRVMYLGSNVSSEHLKYLRNQGVK